MSKYIKVSDFEVADDLFLKKQTVNIGDKTFQTPIKAIDASKIHLDIQIRDDVKGLNEICKFFNARRLIEYTSGARNDYLLNLELDRKIKNTHPKEVTICFVGYEDAGYPAENGINFLMDIAYEFSDATPLPLMPKLFRNDSRDFEVRLEEYMDFLKKCIDSINRSNNKPILGVIPESVQSTYLADLVDFYYDNDIISFIYDFNGKVSAGMRIKIRELMIAIKEHSGSIEKTFLYPINANNGKMIKGAPVVRARDILTFGLGFDSLGDQHIRRFFPPNVAKKIKERIKEKGHLLRLFNSNDYGYYKTSDLTLLESFYPTGETSIPFDNFRVFNSKAIRSQALFNAERLGLEALKYHQLIEEQTDRTSDFFRAKHYVEEGEIKDLLRLRTEIPI